jgi:hypothetical protein
MSVEYPTPIPARELSPEEAQELAERAFELQEKIVAGLQVGREAAWRVAEQLHEFDEISGWLALGYDTLSEWLAQPEVQVNTRTYYRYVHAYRETVVRRRIPLKTMAAIDHSKVDVVIGRVNSGEVRIEDALADARALGWRDLRVKYLKRRPPVVEPASAGTQEVVDEVRDDADAPPEDDPAPGVVVASTAELVQQPAHNPPTSDSGRLPDLDVLSTSIDRALDMRASRATMVGALRACKRFVAQLAEEGVS